MHFNYWINSDATFQFSAEHQATQMLAACEEHGARNTARGTGRAEQGAHNTSLNDNDSHIDHSTI